jgi:hypothetical protein
MLVDCTKCPRRGSGCDGCLVAALYEPPPEVELLDRDELWADRDAGPRRLRR